MAVLEDVCDGKMLLIGQNVYKTVLEKNLERKRKSVKHCRYRMFEEKKLKEKLRHHIWVWFLLGNFCDT